MCGGGCSQAYSTVGYAVEIGRCKAELRRTGTRCPTCDRRCKVDFGDIGVWLRLARSAVQPFREILR